MSRTLDQTSFHGFHMIKHAAHNLMSFFDNLFAQQEFISNLLERNFNQPMGWMELGLSILTMVLTFSLARYIIIKHQANTESKWPFIRHIAYRMLWPILLLVFSIAVLYLWQTIGLKALWLQLLVMAARWMIFIRLSLAIIHEALPQNKMSDAIERTLSAVLWLSFFLWLSGVDNLIIQMLKNATLSIASSTLSLYTILTGLIWLIVIMVCVQWLARSINKHLMKNSQINLNFRMMLSKIIPPLLMILAILIALPMFGINLTVLSVFGGAIGVGIGFGLQKVASNYISGFIILGDRSIRLGDRLTVRNFTGYVSQITARFVVLRSSSGAEALIPNETFITDTVINESYTSKALWKSLDIDVAYHTDLTLAMQILQASAATQPRIETNPAPKAYLLNFGDNGIQLRIGFWVKDPEKGFQSLFSEILLDIWKAFKENNIEFPFPQREIRILNHADYADETEIKDKG